MENKLDDKEELTLYSSAKELSKKILLEGIIRQVSDPGFDIINFARLLEQDDGGENGLNPLHSVFTPNTVQHAKIPASGRSARSVFCFPARRNIEG